ncbi:MAG: hypothetical protein HC888_00545 [Candidatus Competibacteraceae bacterium]|nr:hypothetical protein [Candidatus Competibacteraceae bacterium]
MSTSKPPFYSDRIKGMNCCLVNDDGSLIPDDPLSGNILIVTTGLYLGYSISDYGHAAIFGNCSLESLSLFIELCKSYGMTASCPTVASILGATLVMRRSKYPEKELIENFGYHLE